MTEAPEVAVADGAADGSVDATAGVGDESLMAIVVGVWVAADVDEAGGNELEEEEEFDMDDVDTSRTHVLFFAHV